ncbi:MAG TPA: hypothetical protein VFV54_08880, partial [Thermoanaerobaculia bacterium]|nr:hypothetical protein [Thermoanaerobaculia bacterium]
MPDTPPYVEVAVPLGVHGTFTYAVPEALRDDLRLGSRVEVPYGPRVTTGFVTALVDAPSIDASRIRPIRSILDDEEPALIPEVVELCRRASAYYLAPLGEMLRAALPPNMASQGRRRARLLGDAAAFEAAVERRQVQPDDRGLFDRIAAGEQAVPKLLAGGRGTRASLARLRSAALIALEDVLT